MSVEEVARLEIFGSLDFKWLRKLDSYDSVSVELVEAEGTLGVSADLVIETAEAVVLITPLLIAYIREHGKTKRVKLVLKALDPKSDPAVVEALAKVLEAANATQPQKDKDSSK